MMSVSAEQLAEVARITLNAAGARAAVTALRAHFPALRASTVDAFDMRGETPALHIGDCDLFLMHSDGHCWSVTTDPAEAQAIVLTQRTQ